MTKLICDICGKDINERPPFKLTIKSLNVQFESFEYYNYKDICEECHRKISLFIDNLKHKK